MLAGRTLREGPMAKKHPINHVEWTTRDSARLQHFYGSLFNWKFSEAGPGYTFIETGNKEVGGGIFQIPSGEQMPHGVTNYIDVEDLADYEARILELGGKIMKSRQEVPHMGWFSIFHDVDGNTVALWQALKKKEIKKAEKQARKAAKAAKKEKKAAKKEEKAAKKEQKAAKKEQKRAQRELKKASKSAEA
jgi:predicted enzyme related to lactoylglutathione lyase